MDTTATTTSSKASTTYNLECPISIKWIINEKTLTSLRDSTTNGYLETEKFDALNIPDVKYFISIYPYQPIGKNVWISLNLVRGNEKKMKTNVKYTIESAGITKTTEFNYIYSLGYGFVLCETSELFDPEKKYIVDGKLTITCEGTLSVERERIAAYENGIKFDDEHIGQKLWKNDDKDFTINAGKKSIKVHKCILSAQSPVFKEMFESDIKEFMDINDFSFKVIQSALQFCYLGEASNVLDLKDKTKLLQFSVKYGIRDLKTRFEASLIEDLSASNVSQLANCSIITNAVKLKEKCAELLTHSLKHGTPVNDIGLLDKDFALTILTDACCNVIET